MQLSLDVLFPKRLNRVRLALALLPALLLVAAPAARAQFGAPKTTQVHDASALKPPAGHSVAIIEFYDLECPMCAQTNPQLIAAANQYKIPWIRHDFLIPGHVWSPIAAVNARWFDQKSKSLGDEYRNQVFANQANIYNPDVLAQFTLKFAQSHGLALPFALDPQGKLAADVNADVALATRTGIKSTPTIFIVTAGGKGPAYTQVMNPAVQLFTDIDQAIANTPPAPKPAGVKKVHGE